jgi:hypothetical protein
MLDALGSEETGQSDRAAFLYHNAESKGVVLNCRKQNSGLAGESNCQFVRFCLARFIPLWSLLTAPSVVG